MNSRALKIGVAGVLATGAGVAAVLLMTPSADVYSPRAPGSLTFTRDIAPIVQRHCSECHRPGQPAPFLLLEYEDVRKRARQIAEITDARTMPPWMPEPGPVAFEDARRLSVDELGMIAQWAEEGAKEGDRADLPERPEWAEGWRLGNPDLVVEMPQAYTLRADGPDLYRNFVIPLPHSARRYVKAVELDPGNPRIVHHAFLLLDRTGESRQREKEDAHPGFDGIHTPLGASSPDGYFLSWQPGKRPKRLPEGYSWPLLPATDLILQLHLQPSGKEETIRAKVALTFSDRPPTRFPMKIWLGSLDIDIPAGETDYVLEDRYTLPGDVDVLGILPHGHYLARRMEAFATLPDGARTPLLRINRWDFNWQGDYRYVKPVFLPAGSTLIMKFHYDNSENNPTNPNHPPRRVRYGLQSTDEMAELWLQVEARDPAGQAALNRRNQDRTLQDTYAYNRYLLRTDPRDARAHSGIGRAHYFSGKTAEAVRSFEEAIRLDSSLDEPHYYLGLIHRRAGRQADARQAFTTAVSLNPGNGRAQGNLGLIALELNELGEAEQCFRKALAQNPDDTLAHDSLGIVCFKQGRIREAVEHFRKAGQRDAADPAAQQHLNAAEQALRNR